LADCLAERRGFKLSVTTKLGFETSSVVVVSAQAFDFIAFTRQLRLQRLKGFARKSARVRVLQTRMLNPLDNLAKSECGAIRSSHKRDNAAQNSDTDGHRDRLRRLAHANPQGAATVEDGAECNAVRENMLEDWLKELEFLGICARAREQWCDKLGAQMRKTVPRVPRFSSVDCRTLEAEADPHLDLELQHVVLLRRAAYVLDIEPIDVVQSLARLGQRVADRLMNALVGNADHVDYFVGLFRHGSSLRAEFMAGDSALCNPLAQRLASAVTPLDAPALARSLL
jgi:hypothetical protein